MHPHAIDTPTRSVLVWDLPVRVFHGLIALSFFGAYLSAGEEDWLLLHVTLGYTVAGLVAFRVLWGLVGTRHARFAAFVRGPQAVWRYVTSMRRRQPEHHAGHNPAGALAIVALLVLAASVTATGWAYYSDFAGHWLKEVHGTLGNVMLAVVGVHVAGVVVGSWLHRENLARAMLTGRKMASANDAIRNAWRGLGVLMLVAVLGFWALQWRSAPQFKVPAHLQEREQHDGTDDD